MTMNVTQHVEHELDVARAAAARAVDRAEALAELRSLLYDFEARTRTTALTPDEMWRAPLDEEERAHLSRLVERALPVAPGNPKRKD